MIIFFVVIANSAFAWVDTRCDCVLVSPFNSQNVTTVDDPNIITYNITQYNTTLPANDGTLVGNLTNPTNSSDTSQSFDHRNEDENFVASLEGLWWLLNFLFGGFVFQVILSVGFESTEVIMMGPAIGFLLLLTGVYFITNRG